MMRSFLLLLVISWTCPLFAVGEDDSTTEFAKREAELIPKVKLTDEEVRAFVERFDQAMAAGDMQTLSDKLFDWHLCFDLTMSGLGVSKPFRLGAKFGFIQTVRTERGLLGQIAKRIKEGAQFSYLRTKHVDGRTRVIYRLILPSAGVNYHEYLLTKTDAGTVRAYDVFNYLSGERFSETVRRQMISSSREHRDSNKNLPDADRLFVANLGDIQKIDEQLRQNQPAAALVTYDGLPEEMRNRKFALILALTAAHAAENDSRYEKLIKQYQKTHPDDLGNMLFIDYYILERQYGKALAAIDKLDKSLGGDPYLGIVRSNIYVETSEYDKAEKALEQTIKAEPELKEAYWTRLGVAMLQNDHAATLKWLKEIEQQFPGTTRGITDFPSYNQFRRSPEYHDWQTFSQSR